MNYLIGIGGTGSKCVESFLHLAACGLGSKEEIWMGLVDQDESNGNLRRTRDLIVLYEKLFASLRTNDSNLNNCDLFSTGIKATANKSWCPLPKGSKQFKDHFHYNLISEEQKNVFETLFEKEKRELTLEVGFRGWPSIGAAVFLSKISAEESFWKNIFESIKKAKEGQEVRIFLIASIFGGTGAAGFPNIARLIREKIEKMTNSRDSFRNLYISGALLLPYFSYPSESEMERAAKSDAFLENAQGALKYYSNLVNMKNNRLFDSIYLLGWNPLINLNYFETGGNDQENTPLAPEFFAALAASHFFNTDEIKKGFYISARDKKEIIGWNALPLINEKKSGEIRERMGQLIRFAFAYLSAYSSYLKEDKSSEISGHTWYKKLITKQKIDLYNNNIQTDLERLDRYCIHLLEWIASISYSTKGFKLVSAESFSSIPERIGKGMVKIKDINNFNRNEFDRLIHPLESPSLPLHEIYTRLQTYKNIYERRGIGLLCGALYDLCKVEEK